MALLIWCVCVYVCVLIILWESEYCTLLASVPGLPTVPLTVCKNGRLGPFYHLNDVNGGRDLQLKLKAFSCDLRPQQ